MKKISRMEFDDYYSNHFYNFLFRWLDRRKLRLIARELKSIAPPVGDILDLGAGSGKMARELAKSFGGVVCVDKNRALLDSCMAGGLRAVEANLEEGLGNFADGSVSAVLAADVLEHIANQNFLLSEMSRVLRPGGKAVIFTPPYDGIRCVAALKLHHLVTGRWSDHISPLTAEAFAHKLGVAFCDYKITKINFGLTMAGVGIK
ncbi:MAG: hypothetical protein CVU77_00710 [Elusimicrobia bacterium HGW-Elusimicrobia-1]|jgi:ubiquinone/menaquinone biosynthesis C-methylase UbiE|nr:MAG: hypothetical protein CVU77_00710 [Elusimicrobia bacterium HGW-Elusimicrobia-1]